MKSIILLYTTIGSKKDAMKISQELISQKLVACANMFPIESLYPWKGKLESGKEFGLILKTTKKASKKAIAALKKIHPYKIPCIVEITTKVNPLFSEWLENEIAK